MEVADYRPRIADKLLAELLSAFGAVCVEGPMWCGKTWTSMRQAASICPIGDSSDNFATRRHVEMDIQHAFDGPEPRLIDEWQIVPAIWDATRSQVDRKHGHGRFILTGSATPPRGVSPGSPCLPSCFLSFGLPPAGAPGVVCVGLVRMPF